ncbi:MAG: ribosomal protein L13e [Candidatus Hydrothermarchaeales archaeon]
MIRGKVKRDREGRGFSIGELNEAGLPTIKAKKMGFAVDKRRRTVYPKNVELLRRKSKEIEEEMEKKARARKITKRKEVAKKRRKPKKAEKVKKALRKKVAKKKAAKEKEKIIPLTDIKGLGPKRAKKLHETGVKSANDLIKADLAKVAEETGISTKILERYVSEAKKLK